jgi:hypothetical protein
LGESGLKRATHKLISQPISQRLKRNNFTWWLKLLMSIRQSQ